MGRGAGRVEVEGGGGGGGVETGTVISLGSTCVSVCARLLQVVCDLLAFVMEMGPAGLTR